MPPHLGRQQQGRPPHGAGGTPNDIAPQVAERFVHKRITKLALYCPEHSPFHPPPLHAHPQRKGLDSPGTSRAMQPATCMQSHYLATMWPADSPASARYVRVETVDHPGWVAWSQIKVFGDTPAT
eukprot:355903-Chlamydomonas_euryale.AAC.11